MDGRCSRMCALSGVVCERDVLKAAYPFTYGTSSINNHQNSLAKQNDSDDDDDDDDEGTRDSVKEEYKYPQNRR